MLLVPRQDTVQEVRTEQLLKSEGERSKHCWVSVGNTEWVKTSTQKLRVSLSLPDTRTDSVVLGKMFWSGWWCCPWQTDFGVDLLLFCLLDELQSRTVQGSLCWSLYPPERHTEQCQCQLSMCPGHPQGCVTATCAMSCIQTQIFFSPSHAECPDTTPGALLH